MGHIYLIGFMGSGKSTVGGLLSARLGLPFIDLDSLLTDRLKAEITEIFSRYGEGFFRVEESRVLREVAGYSTPTVVATGGGVVLDEENWGVMESTGTTVHIYAPVEELWKRVAGFSNRPLAKNKALFLKLWKERLPLYNRARIQVNSFNKTPEEVAVEVLDALGISQEKTLESPGKARREGSER